CAASAPWPVPAPAPAPPLLSPSYPRPMSFGLGHGRTLDPAPGRVMISQEELGSLPDEITRDPTAGWNDPRGWFAHPERPFELEIGSGKGTFLIQQAELQPEVNFLGVEWAAEFAAYTADRVRRRQQAGKLTNVRVLRADATEFLRWRTPGASTRVIHLYFSDPCAKRKHHKNRLLQDAFLADAWRTPAPGGAPRVVTDLADLWAWDMEHFARWTAPAGWDLLARRMPRGTPPPAPPAPSAPSPRSPEGDAAAAPAGPFDLLPFDRPASASEGELV